MRSAILPLVLRPNAVFHGLFDLRGPARIDGRVEGEVIASDTLWIGAPGHVIASVSAPEIIVEGVLEGEVRASQRIEIRPGARVSGELHTPRLIVAEGSFFEGYCHTQNPAEDTSADSTPNQPLFSP